MLLRLAAKAPINTKTKIIGTKEKNGMKHMREIGLINAKQIATAMMLAMVSVQTTAKVRLSWVVSISGPGLMPTAISAVRIKAVEVPPGMPKARVGM